VWIDAALDIQVVVVHLSTGSRLLCRALIFSIEQRALTEPLTPATLSYQFHGGSGVEIFARAGRQHLMRNARRDGLRGDRVARRTGGRSQTVRATVSPLAGAVAGARREAR
jgi:hypothetical protein